MRKGSRTRRALAAATRCAKATARRERFGEAGSAGAAGGLVTCRIPTKDADRLPITSVQWFSRGQEPFDRMHRIVGDPVHPSTQPRLFAAWQPAASRLCRRSRCTRDKKSRGELSASPRLRYRRRLISAGPSFAIAYRPDNRELTLLTMGLRF